MRKPGNGYSSSDLGEAAMNRPHASPSAHSYYFSPPEDYMLDPRLYREEVDKIRKGLERRGSKVDLDALVNLDIEKRKLTTRLDQLKSERNAASDNIAKLKKSGGDAGAADAARAEIEKTRALGDQIKELQAKYDEVEKSFKDQALLVPNIPHHTVPDGRSSADNVVVKEWGKKYEGPKPKHHLDVGKELALFDFERGSKISGRGFPIYTGAGARLERALINFFLDTHINENGFTEVQPPVLVNRASMTGTGQLPKFEEDMYRCDDDVFLVPTAEVPITNMHADEILDHASLPISYAGYTPCFRREAGSWGKDTRGFLRLHQFDKVEMVKFVEPAKSYDALEEIRGYAEMLLQKLGLHYRVLLLCAGDQGFGAAKCYDLEEWAPSEEKWLEVSSCSNFEDFQARRAGIRTKIEGKSQYIHTLNGSGLATPRILVALLETYQTENGFKVPEVLRPYMGGLAEITKKKK
jgi:seryl-tRNA synthetase